jgi:GABA permease
MREYLIVANKTLPSEALLNEVRRRRVFGPAQYHVVVPASHPTRTLTWLEATDRAAAQARLDALLRSLALEGVPASGAIGDANPMIAVAEALRTHTPDEVIVSTLPARVSRWLRQDLPHRLKSTFAVVVTHVEMIEVEVGASVAA